MIPISAAEVTMFAEEMYDTTCTIYRNTSTTDSNLNRKASWQAVTSNVPCALQQSATQPSEQGAENRMRTSGQYNLLINRTVDLRLGDQIAVAGITPRFEVLQTIIGSQDPHRIIPLDLVQ